MAKVVIVDDERSLLHSLQLELRRVGHQCHGFETGEQFLHHVEEMTPELVLLDIRLPDMDGLEIIRRIKRDGHEFPIIVMTAFASISNAVAAMREGAVDYVEKPVDLEQLNLVIQRNLENVQIKGRLELLERTQPLESATVELIGQQDSFLKLVEMARRVAAPDVQRAADLPTILLLGETGTGKDMMARYIHQNSPAAKFSFVQLNCAAFPRDLIESELFGYEKGAFTDARATKKGLLEIAGEGTVFLDEIGELAVELQAKLLSALETRSFRRIGGTRSRTMRARIIAATNADLTRRIREGQFREDLFYRLNVFTMALPALRDRLDDLDLLARHFIAKFARKYRKKIPDLSPAALARMRTYSWPGNIRELSHVMENVTLLNDSVLIQPHHLGLSTGALPMELALPKDAIVCNVSEPGFTLDKLEQQVIQQALTLTQGNVSEAAKMLGLSRGALRRRLEHVDNDQ
ncbi:MAG: Regulatory protein AtoC [Phycisphaerae bacterium]|nr:Regulatory protein AtoC [Phycisphaerae bacterium]